MILFVAISLLFIMSARGYGFHFDENGLSLEKTGMIIASSKPSGADIFLDGKKISNRSLPFFSVKIDRLGKKKYTLTIEKEGYYKWQKELKVFPEMVTWANYVLLFSKNPKIEKVDFSGAVTASIASKDNKYTALSFTDKGSEVLYSLDNKSGEKKILLETAKMSEEQKIASVKALDWSKDHKHVLISANLKADKQYFIVNTDTKSLESLSAFTPVKFDSLVFGASSSDDLYGTSGNNFLRVNFKNKTVSSTLDAGVMYFTFSPDGKIYYIKDTAGVRSLWQANSDMSTKTNLSDAIPVSGEYEMKISGKNQKIALFSKTDSALYIVTKVGEKNSVISMGKNISDFEWSGDSERIFYKSKDSNVIVFETDDYKKESKEYDLTSSQNFKNILWYDSRHLLAQSGDKTVIMDFDGTNQVVLGSSPPESRPFFSGDGGDILFVSSVNPEQTTLSRYRVEF